MHDRRYVTFGPNFVLMGNNDTDSPNSKNFLGRRSLRNIEICYF